MVEIHLWLQVHLLVCIVHLGDVCVCAHVLFQQLILRGGQGTCVLGSVHMFTAKLPAAVNCRVYQQHMKASVAHFSTL